MIFHHAHRNDPSSTCRGTRLTAFTLVEVLVVLVLISILAGMVLTAVSGVTQTAREARTRSILATIDSVIQERWESYKYRPLAVEVPSLSAALPAGIVKREVLAPEAARVRLNMIRDLQRMELPDRKSDILNGSFANAPAVITAVAVPVRRQMVGMRERYIRDPSMRESFPVNWYSPTHAPALFESHYRRVQAVGGGWTEEHEGAECLYMIMASSFVGGVPALELIPSNYIGDVDGDGMPEILDGWGQPIEFIRWPSGYQDYLELAETTMLDDFDLLRADFSFLAPPENVTPTYSTPAFRSRSMRPLVISAGADREYGITLRPQNTSGAQVHFRYSPVPATGFHLMTWPINVDHMGSEAVGRSNPFIFVDPFLRIPSTTIPGFVKPGTPLGNGTQADNLTNFQVTAE